MPNNEWDPERPDVGDFFRNLVVHLEDMSEFAEFIADMVMTVAKEVKQELVRNGPEDLEPRLIYMSSREPGIQQIMMSPFTNLVPAPIGVALAMRVAREQFGPPSFVCFVSEGYMKVFEKGHEPKTMQRGDIAADPTHQECISIDIHHRKADGGVRNLYVIQPFHYSEGGIVWDEGHRLDSDTDEGRQMGGAIAEAIDASFFMESN